MNINFRKVVSGLASSAMIGSTVALAAAASYPAPFVQNGAANVAVVFGSNAANTDLVAVADISASLSTKLAAQTATSGGSSSTVQGGDYALLAKSSDRVNVGNTVSTVFGTSVTEDDLGVLLADGTYLNDENTEFKYEQKLTLGSWSLSHFSDSDYKDEMPTVGIRIPASTSVMTYTLDFTTDTESDVVSGDLVDLETTTVKLLGKEYYISDFDNSTLGITLLDAANGGSVKEGETKTMVLGDKSYDVSIDFIDSTSVKLVINGQTTNSLAEGESYRLTDGTYVGVKDISKLVVSGSTGVVEFSLGSGKIEIIQNSNIELNDVSINEITASVTRGTHSGGKERIDKINITWTTDDDEFVTPDQSLVMPAFNAVKLSMGSFMKPKTELVTVSYEGDDSIRLEAPVKDGTAKLNILYANASGRFVGIGKEATKLLKTSGTAGLTFNLTTDDYFVASYNSSRDAESYLLDVSVSESSGYNRTTVKNVVTGTDVCVDKIAGDTCNIGSVSLTVGTVYKAGDAKWANFTAGSNVNFNTLFTKEGLKVHLPYVGFVNASTNSWTPGSKGLVNFTVSPDGNNTGHSSDAVVLYFSEEDKDGNKASGTAFNITINNDADGDIHVTDIDSGQSELEILGSDDDVITVVSSDLATEIKRLVTSSKGKAEITYNGEEAYADIFITDLSASVTGGSSGGGSATELGSVSVLDSEVSSVSGKNLIVVGGSCVNTVAAELLGKSAGTCGADWEAATGVTSGQYLIQTFARSGGKVATLVAGYNAGDTTTAVKYLTSQTVDTTVGMKYKGSSATSATVETVTA